MTQLEHGGVYAQGRIGKTQIDDVASDAIG
jgi:hypothetical protein